MNVTKFLRTTIFWRTSANGYVFTLFDNWNAESSESSLQCMINSSFPVSLSYITFRDTQKPMTSWFHKLTSAVKISKSQAFVGFKATRHSLKKLRKVKRVVKHYVQFFDAPGYQLCVCSSFWSSGYFQHDMWLIKDFPGYFLSNIR